MNRLIRCLTLTALVATTACGDNPDSVTIKLFQAAPDAIELGQSTKLLFIVEPPGARLTIDGIGDVTGQSETMVSPTATTNYHLTAVNGKAKTDDSVTVTVGPQSAAAIKVEPATGQPLAGGAIGVKLTALTAGGLPAPGFRGTVHVSSTDTQAVLPADVTFAAADAGAKQIMVTLETAGAVTLTATQTTNPLVLGVALLNVLPGAAQAYQLSPLPIAADAGTPVLLTITARDGFGNLATSYAGQALVTSTDPTDVLPPAGAFVDGVRTVTLTFTSAGAHSAMVSDVATSISSVATSSIVIGAAAPIQIRVTASDAATVAGTAEPFSAQVVDFFGNTVIFYRGTVHFASTDASAVVPPDFTFSAGDAGVHSFSATLKTAGTQTLTITDTLLTNIKGANAWAVSPAAAASCAATQAPASAVAGSVVGLTVAVHDAFNNVATDYTGTIALTASDARATVPAPVTYVPFADAGSHAFSAQLLTTGNQTLTATDTANPLISCIASIAITPAAPQLLVTVPPSINAGYAVAVNVAVQDIFNNPIPSFAGTVSFTSSDGGTGSVTPAPIVFTGAEGGTATTSATFVTIGSQTLAASDGGSPAAIGSAISLVHGLVYTAPDTGRVRLVVNPALSTAQIVQLDLVANERLEVSSFFGGGPGSFAAGMNLPLDTSRVGPDAALFTAGNALPLGTGTPAAIGRISGDGVLYTAVSRKRIAGTIFTQETEVAAGKVFFSVRLKLQPFAVPGPVFDGAQPSPAFRASVRDQYGDDFVNQGDFGLGRLVVQ